MKEMLTLILLALGSMAYAQTITGKVRDSLTRRLVVGADVRTESGQTKTDLQGEFSIEFRSEGDTLRLIKNGYKALLVPVDEDLPPEVLHLDMYPQAIEIEEVVVTDSTNQIDFKLELERPPKYQQYFGDPSKRLGSSKASGSTSQLLTIDLLSIGRWLFMKKDRETKSLEEIEAEMNRTDQIVSKQLISELTTLRGDSLQIFQNIYRLDREKASKMSAYDIQRYIKQKAKEFVSQ
ncbi:MAG: hypothetical protein ACTHZ1_07370 [Sphingobacterium sp.]